MFKTWNMSFTKASTPFIKFCVEANHTVRSSRLYPQPILGSYLCCSSSSERSSPPPAASPCASSQTGNSCSSASRMMTTKIHSFDKKMAEFFDKADVNVNYGIIYI